MLGAAQLGMAARPQLLDLGISDRAIRRRLANGSMHLVFPGVYAIGHTGIVPAARALASVLAVSPRIVFSDGLHTAVATGAFAASSYETALALHGGIDFPCGLPHVTATRQRRHYSGLILHRSKLDPSEVTVADGVLVTTLARTIFDLACGGRPVRRLIKNAEFSGDLRVADLADVLGRHPSRRGRRNLARIVNPLLDDSRPTRSELEDRFIDFCRRRRLPLPETNVALTIAGRHYEPDCTWNGARLLVELDGRDAHERELAFCEDRERDRRLIAAGWVPMRVTSAHLNYEQDDLEADIRVALDVWSIAPNRPPLR